MLSVKNMGILLIVLGVLISGITSMNKSKEDFYIDELSQTLNGTCVLDSGYCLHEDRDWTAYIIGWVLGIILFIAGAYLLILPKLPKKDVSKEFLDLFTEDEKKILQVIKDNDGIQQSTVRYKTGLSKATTSLILNDLEKRNIVARKPYKKTKLVYLKKRF